MANICTTNYVIEGKREEPDALYQKMKELQGQDLGLLVKALGKNPDEMECRGEWTELVREDETLRMIFVASYLLQSRRTWLRSLFEERCRGQVFP